MTSFVNTYHGTNGLCFSLKGKCPCKQLLVFVESDILVIHYGSHSFIQLPHCGKKISGGTLRLPKTFGDISRHSESCRLRRICGIVLLHYEEFSVNCEIDRCPKHLVILTFCCQNRHIREVCEFKKYVHMVSTYSTGGVIYMIQS